MLKDYATNVIVNKLKVGFKAVKGRDMIKVKPRFIYDEEGEKTGILLTLRDFERIVEELEDFYDYEIVKKRSKKKEKTFTPEQVMAEILEKRR